MDQTYLVMNNWSDKLDDAIGKFVVAPTPQAEQMWEVIKTNPDLYRIEFSYYVEPETGKKEIVGMSVVLRGKDERTDTQDTK